jgi:hypothetical protein
MGVLERFSIGIKKIFNLPSLGRTRFRPCAYEGSREIEEREKGKIKNYLFYLNYVVKSKLQLNNKHEKKPTIIHFFIAN